MKNTIQKIFITLAGLVVSFGSCTLGMYLVFLADEMKFGYYILFSAVFILNPITTILMAVNMFKRPKAASPAAETIPREEKAAKEPKKPKEIRNPFRKETDSSKKDADLGGSFEKDQDAYTSGSFSSSKNEAGGRETDDIFSSHVTVDDEDQFNSN